MQYINKLIYKPLIEITQDFDVIPSIAKEWSKMNENEYLIKIDDITWQDGRKVTAYDVKHTIDTIKSTDSIYKDNVQTIYNIDIIDDGMIKIQLEEETPFFEYLLCFPIIRADTENIGTGEYTIDEINETKIILKNSERKITIFCLESIPELYNKFSREELDVILTKNIDYSKYIGNLGITEQIITGRNFYYIAFSEKLEKNIRKKIKTIINREQIIYDLYNNKYIVADFPLGYGSYLNDYQEKKNSNLNNLPKSLTIGTTENEEMKKIAESIKTKLEENGIKTTIGYYNNFDNVVSNNRFDLLLNIKRVGITPEIDYYFKDEEIISQINKTYKIENKEILKNEYTKIINSYEKEMPFMGLYFNSYMILSNSNVKGNFSGNWYNIFYNVDSWYKVE